MVFAVISGMIIATLFWALVGFALLVAAGAFRRVDRADEDEPKYVRDAREAANRRRKKEGAT